MISAAGQQTPLASIPQVNHLVGPAGRQALTVRTKSQATNFFIVFSQDMQALAGFGIPNVNRLRRVGTGQQTAVGTESQGCYLVAMPVEQDDRLEGLRVPYPSGRVPTAGDQAMTLWAPS